MKLNVYKVLSYILLPVGGYLALTAMLMLAVGLSNVQLLFFAFIFGATSLYMFTSFAFLRKGLMRNLSFKQSMKDLVKVNGIVALLLSAFLLVSGLVVLLSPEVVKTMVDTFKKMNNEALQGKEITAALLKNTFMVMVAICFLLIVHILFTFYYLKKFRHLFLVSDQA